ncbi:TonB-dependent receptor plug domain-containing protein [Microbulbifer taiwanensis]|uniref:TonB-dependent receptor plug domain-containing protein n=1 Tax=Microbulbifer taiwanensis TaxID=986746 RepID=UPI003606D036
MKEQSKQGFNKKTLASTVAAVSAGTLLSVPQVTVAQEAILEEVIVTASARAQNAQDIPYNISAVSGEEITEQNITDATELLRSVSGVAVLDRGYRNSGMANNMIIRGLNVDNGANGDIGLSSVSPFPPMWTPRRSSPTSCSRI